MTKNTAKNLRRRLLKGNLWPPVYNARIRVWNTKAKQEEVQQLSFLLPHEVLAVMKTVGEDEVLYDVSGCDPVTLQHLRFCEGEAGGIVGSWSSLQLGSF